MLSLSLSLLRSQSCCCSREKVWKVRRGATSPIIFCLHLPELGKLRKETPFLEVVVFTVWKESCSGKERRSGAGEVFRFGRFLPSFPQLPRILIGCRLPYYTYLLISPSRSIGNTMIEWRVRSSHFLSSFPQLTQCSPRERIFLRKEKKTLKKDLYLIRWGARRLFPKKGFWRRNHNPPLFSSSSPSPRRNGGGEGGQLCAPSQLSLGGKKRRRRRLAPNLPFQEKPS